jgi:hypothetical protein
MWRRMQARQAELEEIEMNAEIGGYQPDAPDARGDEPAFVRNPPEQA